MNLLSKTAAPSGARAYYAFEVDQLLAAKNARIVVLEAMIGKLEWALRDLFALIPPQRVHLIRPATLEVMQRTLEPHREA